MIRRISLCVMVAAVSAAQTWTLQAQRGGGPQGSGTAGPATVEFVATAADGRLITDLAADQLSLKVANRDRAITGLELVRFDGPASTLPAPYGSNNRSDAGRPFIFVIDEESMRVGLETVVRDALLAFEKTLTPRDSIGLFAVPRGSISVPPTTDREAFRAAVARLQGRQKTNASTTEQRCHTRDVLSSLTGILGGVQSGGGVTPVVVMTSGLVGASTSTTMMSGTGISATQLGGPEECFLPPAEFQRLGSAADTARAQLYVVRPEESGTGASEGIENLTGVTGGQMLFLGGGEAMARIGRETSAYYVATYTADANERTGQSQRVELRSTRSDVTVRARASAAIPRGPREAPTPQSMLREVTVHRDFGLRTIGIASRNDGDAKNDMKLIALAEPTDPAVKFKSAAAGLIDPAGKLIAQWTARPEELQRSPMVAALAIPSGQYRLRMAAVDTNGRAATADYEIFARTTDAGAAKLGGLMVGAASGAGFAPIVRVTDQQELVVVFELYGRPTGPFGAIVEILDSPTAEKALVEAPPTPSQTAVQDKFMFMAKLPIASLKSGDYIVRARLGFEGQPTGTLQQTVRVVR